VHLVYLEPAHPALTDLALEVGNRLDSPLAVAPIVVVVLAGSRLVVHSPVAAAVESRSLVVVGLAENLVVVVHSPEAAEAENLPADQILDHLEVAAESPQG
jgi:hypothetical protein